MAWEINEGAGDLERLIRCLIRMLRAEVLPNTVLSTSVDYRDGDEGVRAIPLASLPCLALTGPDLIPSRAHATNVPASIPTKSGLLLLRPSRTVDLEFGVAGACAGTAAILALAGRLEVFLNRHPWISMERDEHRPELGEVRWELESIDTLRMSSGDRTGVRSFTCGLAIRGFDVDEGVPFGPAAAPLAGAVISADPFGESR